MSKNKLEATTRPYAMAGHVWVIEVCRKRRAGKPVEAVAITTGGLLRALLLAKEIAAQLKLPSDVGESGAL